MDLGIAGRTAVVLASTDGLGAAVARALAAEGVKVVVTGRDPEKVRRVADSLPGGAGVVCDLSRPGAADEIFDTADILSDGPDIVVLNGPGPVPGRATDLDETALHSAVDILLAANIGVVNRALPGMRRRRWGRVVAIGSSGVEAPLPGLATSNLGRAALAAYLKTLAAEVAVDGVTVNMVLPGRIATGRVESLDQLAAANSGRTVEQVRAASRSRIPVGRYGRPDELGAVAAFLCGEPASYVTGGLIRCDGGLLGNL
ncbi:SDR family oxidoreductase [Nocardia colli]|uniref:3-oxoacyl-[acyl-carrier-protein] reductase MabA n=1 Tax=Nocardia colli TaxID=2545717 RepID=A0A5N0DXC4_9NOCA|nr:SDR family oxidoreductase [Nocardia colli]KAA8880604.1 SDR family oxidoreductase [Nocardia colli]